MRFLNSWLIVACALFVGGPSAAGDCSLDIDTVGAMGQGPQLTSIRVTGSASGSGGVAADRTTDELNDQGSEVHIEISFALRCRSVS